VCPSPYHLQHHLPHTASRLAVPNSIIRPSFPPPLLPTNPPSTNSPSLFSQELTPPLVIHFITASSASSTGAADLPRILAGDKSVTCEHAIATQNYSQRPVAVIRGGAYNGDLVEGLRAAVKTNPDAVAIPWLVADVSLDKTKPGPDTGYVEELVGRIKEVLKEKRREGTMGRDEVVMY